MKVQDLDILRPESNFIKIGGKEIDVSFIPCAITFDIDNIMQEINNLDADKLRGSIKALSEANGDNVLIEKIKLESKEEIKKGFNLSVKLCSIFCEHSYPEMDEEWFNNSTDALQINAFATAIKKALNHAYDGIRTEGKNLKAAKKNH